MRPASVLALYARLACWGDPEYTFAIERASSKRFVAQLPARYELRCEAVRSGEMETLKRLEAKYRTVAPSGDEGRIARPSSAAPEVAQSIRLPCKPASSEGSRRHSLPEIKP